MHKIENFCKQKLNFGKRILDFGKNFDKPKSVFQITKTDFIIKFVSVFTKFDLGY